VRLYEQALREADTEGKDLLEVGCGRGGGSSYMLGHLAPASVTGIDISPGRDLVREVRARGRAPEPPRRRRGGDPVRRRDVRHRRQRRVVALLRLDVEVSLRGAARPAPWRDARLGRSAAGGKLADTQRSFARSGLDVVRATDITANVLRSLEATSDEKIALVDGQVPLLLRPLVKSGMAVRGTVVYEALANGDLVYLGKPAAAG
jgi:SAM-dependent methyltransferase